MGADGGICWIRVLDRPAFDELTSWFAWRVLNQSAYAYKGAFAADVPDPPDKSGEWLEGAFGTDCDFDLEDIISLVRFCLDPEPDWVGRSLRSANEDIRDYTFAEVEEALYTDPFYNVWGYQKHFDWWSHLGPIEAVLQDHLQTKFPCPSDGHLSQHNLGQVPDTLKNMTLREWGQRLNKAIDIKSYYCEQTWT